MRFLRYLLWPPAAVYKAVTALRNMLYDKGIFRSHGFDIPIIVVGNITVGGTGKSPMVALVGEQLRAKGYRPGIISRGYGRHSAGFIALEANSEALRVGDEPLQLYRHFGGSLPVAVCEDRMVAVPELLQRYPDCDIILMDDAFQHRRVRARINIVLMDYSRPLWEDALLPMGRLREAPGALRRADMLVVTKCPENLSEEDMNRIRQKSRSLAVKALPVYFSYTHYEQPRGLWNDELLPQGAPIIGVSALAQNEPFMEHLKNNYALLGEKGWRDHYPYYPSDLTSLAEECAIKNASLVITEKDAAKWKSKRLAALAKELPVYVLPVRHAFFHGQEAFFQQLHAFLQANDRE